MEPLLELDPKAPGGYKEGSAKNLSDIKKYIKPILNELGFNCIPDKNDGTSNKQLIYCVADTRWSVLTQIIIVETLHSINSRANSNISEALVNTTTEAERIHAQLEHLKKKNVWLLLFVKTGGNYIFVRYDQIPEEHYKLTYRGRPDRMNRIWIPPEYLPKFKKIHHLKSQLEQIFNITFDDENK